MAAAEAGARAELARAGQLASCSPRPENSCAVMIVEILRVEEVSEGIATASRATSPRASPDVSAYPLARGIRITVTGRARIRASGAERDLRDTGDLRATEIASRGSGDAARVQVDRDEIVRLASRKLGERLARRLLGVPEPGDE